MVAVAITLGLAGLCLERRTSSVRITNPSPEFQVLSAQITSGTNSIHYFPNRVCALKRKVAVALFGRFPSLVPRLGEKIQVSSRTAFRPDEDRTLYCWLEFQSKKPPGMRRFGMVFMNSPGVREGFQLTYDPPGLSRRRIALDLCEPFSRWDASSGSGVLCFSSSSKLTKASGGNLELVTPLGKSTINFR